MVFAGRSTMGIKFTGPRFRRAATWDGMFITTVRLAARHGAARRVAVAMIRVADALLAVTKNAPRGLPPVGASAM